MRITKKLLREVKSAMHARVNELCKLEDPSWLAEEFKRVFPYAEDAGPVPTAMKRRMLLGDMIERAIPSHLVD